MSLKSAVLLYIIVKLSNLKRIVRKLPFYFFFVQKTKDFAIKIPVGFFSSQNNSISKPRFKQMLDWNTNAYTSPPPYFIKQICIKRNAVEQSVFVETGTCYGDTTKFLSTFSKKVISLEPAIELYKKSEVLLADYKNVQLLNGTSEDIFPVLIPTLKGNVSFWLDGHFSGGNTFKGKTETPIIIELAEIKKSIKNFDKVSILVDDFRCFDPTNIRFRDYPTQKFLVDWAEENQLRWNVEFDIFIAKNF